MTKQEIMARIDELDKEQFFLMKDIWDRRDYARDAELDPGDSSTAKVAGRLREGRQRPSRFQKKLKKLFKKVLTNCAKCAIR